MNLKRASKPFMIMAATAAVAGGIGIYGYREEHRPRQFELYIFDVKGGPAFLLRTPGDERIIVDGGASGDIIRKITGILPFYSRRIDAIVATADDGSRVSGLVEVAQRYDIGSAYVPALTSVSAGMASSTDPAYSALLISLGEKKVPIREVAAGDSISFGSGVFGQILFPLSRDGFAYGKASMPEIAMRIYYGDTSVIILGGASKKIQKAIASSSTEKSDALIVSNSGSADSLSGELISRIQPKIFIYSKVPSKSTPKNRANAKSRTTSKTKSDKKITDPLSGVTEENRLNIREKGMIRLVSDGTSLK